MPSAGSRRKSPRAPSFPLEEAIERTLKIYEKENRHSVPVDVAAGHIGYKDASNGAAMSALATLRYYGLVERPSDGILSVSKDIELYKFSPDENIKKQLISGWLKCPPVFSSLLDKYTEGLPSDGTIKYDLIQMGFAPNAADTCLSAFRRSVEFARFYDNNGPTEELERHGAIKPVAEEFLRHPTVDSQLQPSFSASVANKQSLAPVPSSSKAPMNDFGVDRIPVRLRGGRRAWIEVPSPFYEEDKEHLIMQIRLLMVDDDVKKA